MDQIGRYRILGELGHGAMGVVYHATDPSIGRPVAIKTIRIRDINDTRQREKLRERLFREARSAGVLSHPNIVTIYDMDEVDGLAYIAMAFVNGPSLDKVLAGSRALTGAEMMRILRQTALALDYAHGRGIVHRDVKPGNIMTDEDGSVKITDFGIAKIAEGANTNDTRTVAGTPNYMSPEQVQGFSVDGKSDQFSLAVIAYEILTGERPFTGEHLSNIVFKIVGEDPPECFRINTTLTPSIDQVLRRGLAKRPENRYPNCASFVGALEMACAESRGWRPMASGAAAAMATAGVRPDAPAGFGAAHLGTLGISPTAGMTPDPPKKRLFPVVMSLTIVLAAVAAITWQAGGIPSFGPHTEAPQQTKTEPEPIQAPPAVTEPEPSPAKEAAPDPADQAPPVVAEAKPSPLDAGKPAPPEGHDTDNVTIPAAPPTSRASAPANFGMQDVWVTTNPPGAKVVLDDNLDQNCHSPCMLHSPSGVHHLTISDAGYQNEYREIHVGGTAQDIPLITLRQPRGTLMIATVPTGASVRIDGKPLAQPTPTEVSLAPGSYTVTVEKNGHTQTQRVDLSESLLYLKIPLEQ